MRWIKDSLHGDIGLTPLANALIDTPEMQRLRRIGQTAFCNLLYPGANHTRFEHSVGVYHLTRKACQIHGISDELLEAAGLLHDVGHSCFSHTLEGIVKEKTGKDHEGHSREKIMTGNLADVLVENGYSPKKLVKLMNSPEYELVHSYLGTDKIDYLLRDSKYTGVAYGSVDADRIIRKTKLVDGKLVIDEKGLSVAESMLIARFMMFSGVYTHHVPYSAEELLVRAVERAIEEKLLNAKDLVTMDDWTLMSFLNKQEGFIGEMASRLMNRELFKEAIKKPLKSFDNWHELTNLSRERRKELEGNIAVNCGIEPEQVMLYLPSPWFEGSKINVKRGDKIVDMGEVSIISRVLKEAQWDYSYISILCSKEIMNKIKKDSLKVLESV
ncbi:MAG: HD domain-containing protein [Candidatus Diapherotrites archaeon]|nr:HD domain-containing protein [Candidatus Diapherotrites archaeon]